MPKYKCLFLTDVHIVQSLLKYERCTDDKIADITGFPVEAVEIISTSKVTVDQMQEQANELIHKMNIPAEPVTLFATPSFTSRQTNEKLDIRCEIIHKNNEPHNSIDGTLAFHTQWREFNRVFKCNEDEFMKNKQVRIIIEDKE